MDPTLDHDDVAFAGVLGQLALLRGGRLTPLELVELCLQRIDRLDGRFNAFRTTFPGQARADAEAADRSRTAGDERPLLGIPVAVKDNVHVAGHAPSMGTASPEPAAGRDAELVRRLRAAGAVVVGTTHLPELALWPFTESQTFGATRNPWSPGHSAGGSSGGSAAAVAAGMVPAATASDGGGSIRIPAAACGLVGLKPQRGKVPLAPDTEHWHGLSSAGILTRSVADQALVLSILTDGQVSATPSAPGSLRIAWSTWAPFPTTVHPAVQGALEGAVAVLRGVGHVVQRGDPAYGKVGLSFLARYGRGARDDLVRLVDPSATEPRTRAVAAVGARLSDRALTVARRWGDQAAVRLATLPDGADVLLTPTLAAPPAAVGALTGPQTLALSGRVVPHTPAWNVTGQPAVSLPAGHTADGLPLAVQLVGPPDSEDLLLALALQYEAATPFSERRPPL